MPTLSRYVHRYLKCLSVKCASRCVCEICVGKVRYRLHIVFTEGRKHRLGYYNGDACSWRYFCKLRQSFENEKCIWIKEFCATMPFHYSLTVPPLFAVLHMSSVKCSHGSLDSAASASHRAPWWKCRAVSPRSEPYDAVRLDTALVLAHVTTGCDKSTVIAALLYVYLTSMFTCKQCSSPVYSLQVLIPSNATFSTKLQPIWNTWSKLLGCSTIIVWVRFRGTSFVESWKTTV